MKYLDYVDTRDPKYEAIEVMAQVDTNNPESKLIRIFFTERFGNKKQVHYFNNSATAGNWKGEAYFRTVEYETSGEPGHPLNLHIKFPDKDCLWVEWTVNFEPTFQPILPDTIFLQFSLTIDKFCKFISCYDRNNK